MKTATIARTDRVAESSEGRGRTFESCRVRHPKIEVLVDTVWAVLVEALSREALDG